MVFNEISLLTGFYWLEFYKYKISLNLETGMEKKDGQARPKHVVVVKPINHYHTTVVFWGTQQPSILLILNENHRGEDNLKTILCLLTNIALYYNTAQFLFWCLPVDLLHLLMFRLALPCGWPTFQGAVCLLSLL